MARATQSAETIENSSINLSVWLVLTIFLFLSFTLFYETGLSTGFKRLFSDIFNVAVGIASTRYLATRRSTYRLGIGLGAFFQASTFASAALIMTYAVATFDRPLADALMLKADRSIGYDWVAYVGWFAHHPMVSQISSYCYNSNFLQPIIIISLGALYCKADRLNKYLLENVFALCFVTSVFALLPVTTAWVHEGISANEISSFHWIQRSDQGWVNELLKIRSGNLKSFPNGFSEGLIGFPSFHAVSAILNIRAFWPYYRLRMIMLPLNMVMLAATPVFGGHYVSDVIVGGLVAIFVIAFIELLYPKMVAYWWGNSDIQSGTTNVTTQGVLVFSRM